MKRVLLFALLCLFSVQPQAQTRHTRHPLQPIPTRSPQAASAQSSLPIRRVILYSNGVAYIERRGTVSDHAEVALSFKQSQVDDVLKSMVVLDLGKGRIGAVSYNSSAPPSVHLAEIPFAIAAATEGNNGGLAGVLSQLQGARVTVVTAKGTVTGSVLNVETQHSQVDSHTPPVTTNRLVIASDNGALTAFDLAEVRSVQLVDEGSRRDLAEFAHAAASARRRDAKTIVVTSDGRGERELIVSYTIAAPIWKTTYRVLLDATGKPFFQGWAIVDNVSEEDWTAIDLSLVSGTPVSFIQPIQNPVYRYRPVVPLPEDLNLKPQTYEPGEGFSSSGSLTGTIKDPNGSAIPGANITITNSTTNQTFEITTDNQGAYRGQNLPPGTYSLSVSAANFKKFTATNLTVRPGLRAKFNASLDVGSISETVTVTATDGSDLASSIESRQVLELPIQSRNYANLAALNAVARSGSARFERNRESLSNLVSRHESGVADETTGSEVGDLFQYHIDQPVTVPRDRSALIPILQTRMEGERVSIYRATSDSGDEDVAYAHRPMSGMLLKNISPLTLEDGSLTVIDGDAYAGEALLERLKPAEERLISFAVDLGTLVNARAEDEQRQPVFQVRSVNGVFQTHYYNVRQKVYTLVNQTDRPRIVYLEHPRDEDDDWELTAGTTAPITRTANYYRFRIELAAHQTLEFPISERNEEFDSYTLTNFTRDNLELFIARKYLDDQTRAALESIIALKDKVAAASARLQLIEKEAAEIAQDQARLRENIKALAATAEARQLIARYVSKANEQETRLEKLEAERRTLTDDRARLQNLLDAAIRNLSFDRRL
jgi:Carboxypeptidase regulatory-like domain